jgi:hypothetical protein
MERATDAKTLVRSVSVEEEEEGDLERKSRGYS